MDLQQHDDTTSDKEEGEKDRLEEQQKQHSPQPQPHRLSITTMTPSTSAPFSAVSLVGIVPHIGDVNEANVVEALALSKKTRVNPNHTQPQPQPQPPIEMENSSVPIMDCSRWARKVSKRNLAARILRTRSHIPSPSMTATATTQTKSVVVSEPSAESCTERIPAGSPVMTDGMRVDSPISIISAPTMNTLSKSFSSRSRVKPEESDSSTNPLTTPITTLFVSKSLSFNKTEKNDPNPSLYPCHHQKKNSSMKNKRKNKPSMLTTWTRALATPHPAASSSQAATVKSIDPKSHLLTSTCASVGQRRVCPLQLVPSTSSSSSSPLTTTTTSSQSHHHFPSISEVMQAIHSGRFDRKSSSPQLMKSHG